ncbi:MAG: hypothetical protein K6C41_09275 [Lachnospiraceae bacterium]|nr:hypothetical protein [Lachnospiraceae bacterium]
MDLYDRLFGDSAEDNTKKKEEPKEEVVKAVEEKALEAPKAPETPENPKEEPQIKWNTDFQNLGEGKGSTIPPTAPSEVTSAAPAQKSVNVEKALGNVGEALDEMAKAVNEPIQETVEAPVEETAEKPANEIVEKPIEKPVSKIGEEEQKDLMKPEDGDDRLFEQIDAFREKAQQLSAIIHSKQTKVANLEALVGEKEEQNRYLHDEVDRLKSQSDKLVIELDSRIKTISDGLSADIDDLKKQFLEKADTANAPLIEKVDTMNSSFSNMKEEVFDKVHTENLQAYKNVQSFIQENDKSEDNRVRITTEVYKLRKFLGFLIFLGLVDTAGIAVLILHMFGFF